MEPVSHAQNGRTRVVGIHDMGTMRIPPSRNKRWVVGEGGQKSGYHSDGERWERGGHIGGRGMRGAFRGGRGKSSNVVFHVSPTSQNRRAESESADTHDHIEEATLGQLEEDTMEQEEPLLETPEEREKFYQELVKAREIERKKAIAEGKMDDPSIPKRLEDAISVVGTCLDMCPRFERYRRERENNLFEWETIPGTKRVDHKRAVKMYERAAGDKTLPSDLRPPHVLKRTLDYLFHDLLPRGGFSQTFNFIRDRSRAVRNDFTMQHNYGAVAIECHDRCARFHILALHFERDRSGFSIALEEQQLMNTLQSLKEFYEDQRGRYESPTELEMRVYHRLIHIRDQKERHENIPEHITSHPVFQLTTNFRVHVQRKSAPISKTSTLVVDAEAMQIFSNLANVLREQGDVVMIYLVACILERLFGKDAIDDIESIRGGLSIPDVIDGISSRGFVYDAEDNLDDEVHSEHVAQEEPGSDIVQQPTSAFFLQPTALPPVPAPHLSPQRQPVSAFSTISATPNVFNTPSPFGASAPSSSSAPTFGVTPPKSVFGPPTTSHTQALAPFSSFPSTAATPANAPSLPALPLSTSVSLESTFPNSSSLTASQAISNNPITSDSQSTPFNVEGSANKSTLPSLKPTSTPGTRPGSDTFGQSSHGPVKSFPSLDFSGSATPRLNPEAPVFTPKLSSPSSFSPFSSSNPNPVPVTSNTSTPVIPLAPQTPSFPSSSSKKHSPPSTQRTSTTPPILPKINTDTSSNTFRQTNPATPTLPPPLPRYQPIALPSTPTLGVQPFNPLLSFLKGSLQTPVLKSNQEVLSPLCLSSPTTSGHSTVHNFSPNGKSKSVLKGGDRPIVLNGKDNIPAEVPHDNTELEVKMMQFVNKSSLVKSSFRHWRHQILQRAAWIEACQQSDTYSQKIKHQRNSFGLQSEKKRKVSVSQIKISSPQKKRARRRISSDYQPPRTDGELAKRFKEDSHAHHIPIYLQNHAEHERRWAQGSFLTLVQDHIKMRLNGAAPHTPWRIWLSMNPDIDATAIWLERKFDVPASGDWASETVFSIPLMHTKDPPVSSDSPGIIIFECTPLEGVTDDLERKYRVLDDCARLRDIVNNLPSKRHFIPSLLVISWIEGDQAETAPDFVDMAKKLVEHQSILCYHVFSITRDTKDLDGKLDEALHAMDLDLDGKLIRSLTIRDTFKLFEPSFMSFISEWIENCSANGNFDWCLFGRIVQIAVDLMNRIARSVCGLISEDIQDLLAFDGGDVADNNSAYDSIMSWLLNTNIGESAERIALNLQSHRDIGQDFPARTFIEHLWDLIQSQIEIRLKRDPKYKFYIHAAEIKSTLEALTYQPHRAQLGQILHMSIRRSPKRRSISVDTDLTSVQSKRRRLSSPTESNIGEVTPRSSPYLNGRLTPSPTSTSASVAPSEEPTIVTIAMLRALTRDLKKKYTGQ